MTIFYIGVVGKQGGREFPLDVQGFNYFEKAMTKSIGLGQYGKQTS